MDEAEYETDGPLLAVFDHVITPSSTGFTEHHEIGLAYVKEPNAGDYVQGPERVPWLQGIPLPSAVLRGWGYETNSEWKWHITKARSPVESPIPRLGVIMPRRGTAPVQPINADKEGGGR